MRAVAYIRVSDASQVEGYSLDAQERSYVQFCKERDWIPFKVYREEGKSARYEAIRKRPILEELLADVEHGKCDVVIVHTLDRWSRNLKVSLEALGILGQRGVGLISITENIDYSTPHGKLATQMIGGMAEYFSNMLAVHVKKGIGERALQGRHLGSIPFGYESCWNEKDGERVLRCKPEHPRSPTGGTGGGRAIQKIRHRNSHPRATGILAQRSGIQDPQPSQAPGRRR